MVRSGTRFPSYQTSTCPWSGLAVSTRVWTWTTCHCPGTTVVVLVLALMLGVPVGVHPGVHPSLRWASLPAEVTYRRRIEGAVEAPVRSCSNVTSPDEGSETTLNLVRE